MKDEHFDGIFGMDVTLIIKSFYSSSCPNMDGLYGSRNLVKLTAKVSPGKHMSNEDDMQIQRIDY